MSRKDFDHLASIILNRVRVLEHQLDAKQISGREAAIRLEELQAITANVCNMCEAAYSRFKRQDFIAACGLSTAGQYQGTIVQRLFS